MKSHFPTLVVALYNRVNPMNRLLDSLNKAYFPSSDINLVISIDNDNYKSNEVAKVANEFTWNHGNKEVVFHNQNFGIRDHFNYCGSLSFKYGSIIFLEDDLFVSPHFYDYALQALDFFSDEPKVAGISLFSYNRIEQWENPWPFTALHDGYDNYFLQQASWGQIWTESMWKPFIDWYENNADPKTINKFEQLPITVRGWPASSWKKYFIAYMILHQKYYVFPRIALATNFDDVGINRKTESIYYQSPLLIERKDFSFGTFDNSLSKYDSYFEILPEVVKKLNPELRDYDFAMNIYGNKLSESIKNDFVISKAKGTDIEKSFNLVLKPHESNTIFNVPGNKLFLCRKDSINDFSLKDDFFANFSFFYRKNFTIKEILRLLILRVKFKLGL